MERRAEFRRELVRFFSRHPLTPQRVISNDLAWTTTTLTLAPVFGMTEPLGEIEMKEKEAAADEACRAAECAPAEAERERLAALREEARAKARAVEAAADDTTRALQREVRFSSSLHSFLASSFDTVTRTPPQVDAMDAADKPIEGYYARAVAAQLTRAKAELDDAEGKLESLRTEFAEIEKKGKKHKSP